MLSNPILAKMKKLFLSTALGLFFTTCTFAQLRVVVAIASIKHDKMYCRGNIYLPEFEIKKGENIPEAELRKQALAALEEKYASQYKDRLRIEKISSDEQGTGNMLTILSSNIDTDGCKQFMYGVGFGKTKDESLKNALHYLASNNWGWELRKDYKIVTQELITGE